jgi:hypothetical protein
MLSASSIRIGKIIVGESASWRGIGDPLLITARVSQFDSGPSEHRSTTSRLLMLRRLLKLRRFVRLLMLRWG